MVSHGNQNHFSTRLYRKIWTICFGQASWINRTGSFREKEYFGLIDRPNYAYGMLRAADTAKYFGYNKITVCEFGVASGYGLTNMIELAETITQETGVEFRIVGFDTGEGLPEVAGYQDHPEIWMPGDFTMTDKSALLSTIGERAELILGDIKNTIDDFTASIEESAPIGFMSIDVDIYTASKSALRCLQGDPNLYLPAISMYFDDVSFYFANRWCGELLAINEFNDATEFRKIGPDRSLPVRRISNPQPWHNSMYVCHVLDNQHRQSPRDRDHLTIEQHHEFLSGACMY